MGIGDWVGRHLAVLANSFRNAVTYETAPLGRGIVQSSVKATGTVNAVVDVQVGSQVSGNINALYADFNTKVIKGQLVASNRKGNDLQRIKRTAHFASHRAQPQPSNCLNQTWIGPQAAFRAR